MPVSRTMRASSSCSEAPAAPASAKPPARIDATLTPRRPHAASAAHRGRAVQQDVGVVDVARDRVEILVGLLAQDFAARRIDRQDLAGEAVLAQEALRPRCRFGDIGRGADQRDALRLEQGGEQDLGIAHARVYSAHAPSPLIRRRDARRRRHCPPPRKPRRGPPSPSSSSCPTRPAARPTSWPAWSPSISARSSARTSSSTTSPARAPWSARRSSPRRRPTATRC